MKLQEKMVYALVVGIGALIGMGISDALWPIKSKDDLKSSAKVADEEDRYEPYDYDNDPIDPDYIATRYIEWGYGMELARKFMSTVDKVTVVKSVGGGMVTAVKADEWYSWKHNHKEEVLL